MDRNIEDKIAMLAFGELSEAESAELRSQIEKNADTALALESYEALRSDLRRLRDVPPDQLSKERLQNAILTQGLQPKPIRRAFPWIWATPAAMAAAFLFLFFMRTGPAPEQATPQLDTHPELTAMLNQDDVVLASSLAGFDGQPVTTTDESALSTEPATTEKPVAAPQESHAAATRRPSRRRHASDLSHSPLALSIPADTSASGVAPEPSKKASESLVLIQSQADGNTGAKNAVEVHQTADVIVSS